jgi:hypothetical protein
MSNARFSILQARAVSDARVSDAQFRTLAALGMYADKDGWCFPSLTRIGADCNKSKQAAGRDVINLKKLGYVEVYPQFDKSTGSRKPNKYRLKFDLPPSTSDVDTPSTSEAYAPSTSDVDVNVPVNDPTNDPKRPPAPKPARAARPDNPASIFFANGGKGISKDEAATLAACEISDLARWGQVVKAWIACGWSPRNFSGMAEYYQRGEMPAKREYRQRAQTVTADTGNKVSAEVDAYLRSISQ